MVCCRSSLVPIRIAITLRRTARTRHIRIPILVISRFVSNRRSVRSIRSSEVGGGLVGGQGVGLLCGSELRVAVLALALPEPATGRTGCVPVVGGGPEGFLFLVLPDQAEFNND